MSISDMSPRSGRTIGEDGNVYNEVALMQAAGTGDVEPVSDKVHDITKFAVRSGRVLGEDGKAYNEVAFWNAIAARIAHLQDMVDRLEMIHQSLGVTTTPLYDGATTNPITVNGESVTAIEGDLVFYNGEDFVYNNEGVWLSVTSAFGALAYKNMANWDTDIANKPTLGTASEKDVEYFATSVQGDKADAALPKTGGAMTGDISTSVTEFTSTSLITKGYVDGIVGDINNVLEGVL